MEKHLIIEHFSKQYNHHYNRVYNTVTCEGLINFNGNIQGTLKGLLSKKKGQFKNLSICVSDILLFFLGLELDPYQTSFNIFKITKNNKWYCQAASFSSFTHFQITSGVEALVDSLLTFSNPQNPSVVAEKQKVEYSKSLNSPWTPMVKKTNKKTRAFNIHSKLGGHLGYIWLKTWQ